MRRSIDSARSAWAIARASERLALTPIGKMLQAWMHGEAPPTDASSPTPPLPTGRTMAEQRLIELLPKEAEVFLRRQARLAEYPSPAQVAFARKILEGLDSR